MTTTDVVMRRSPRVTELFKLVRSLDDSVVWRVRELVLEVLEPEAMADPDSERLRVTVVNGDETRNYLMG